MPRSRPRESPDDLDNTNYDNDEDNDVVDNDDDDDFSSRLARGMAQAGGGAPPSTARRGVGGPDRLDFDDEHVTDGRGTSGRRGSARSRRECFTSHTLMLLCAVGASVSACVVVLSASCCHARVGLSRQ